MVPTGNRLLGAGWTAERGYLLAPVWLRQLGSGDWTGAGHLDEGARLGERYGDRDLLWLARDEQARAC